MQLVADYVQVDSENVSHLLEKKVPEKKKTYCLDTNVLLSDPNSIFSFEEHDIIIPLVVLEELDRHKSRPDEVGKNARQISRSLDDMRQAGSSLFEGVKLVNGGTLKVVHINQETTKHLPIELASQKVDNMIIAFMQYMYVSNSDAILVSQDINVRLKCDALNIKCDDYRKMRVTSDSDNFYTGVKVMEVDESIIDHLYQHKEVDLPDSVIGDQKLYPNEIIVIKTIKDSQTKSAICKCIDSSGSLIAIEKIDNAFGLKPRNKEQNFSLDLLFDENVKLLTLVGPSGTGKTLLAIAAALSQLKGLGDMPRYEKLIVTRPVQPVGKDIGFLPGTMEEKMEPWIAPIRDNLNFLMGSKKAPRPRRQTEKSNDGRFDRKKPSFDEHYLSIMQDRGLIEIEAITFIRGRSIPNSFIIIDEAQNLSMHELKTIITRVGDNTKIVLTGDIEQIDNVHVDVFTNGLTYAIERFKEHSIAGHVTLKKGERSALATLASKIL